MSMQHLSPQVLADDDLLRSDFMKCLIAGSASTSISGSPIPRVIVQFWNDSESVPADVHACLDTWRDLEQRGFTHILFNDKSAKSFIQENFSPDHVVAFAKCAHPAMRSDYLRLCYVALLGGIYVDADDIYTGVSLEDVLTSAELTLQPLCYDVTSDSMLDPVEYASQAVNPNKGRIFYVNNNPLIAAASHPIVVAALERSTQLLLTSDDLRDIQSLTGPGNLTRMVVAHAAQLVRAGQPLDFRLHPDWQGIAVSQWPLEYRQDERNWRNWTHPSNHPEDYPSSGVSL